MNSEAPASEPLPFGPNFIMPLWCTNGGVCRPPVKPFAAATPSRTIMIARKKYVGTAKRRPDSRTARRLPTAMTRMHSSDSSTDHGPNAETAEASAAMPAATDTETVST